MLTTGYRNLNSFANNGTNLRQLHLHVGKNMQESHHSIPQSAVSETLLVPNARTLKMTTQTASEPIRMAQKCIVCRCYVTWLPVCTLLKSWKPAWPPPALWRSSSDLPHLWHPSQSSTSRNHWWIPDRRRQHDLVHWMNMWLSTGSDCIIPEVLAGSRRCWWWCSLLLCSQSESSRSSESLMQVGIKIFFFAPSEACTLVYGKCLHLPLLWPSQRSCRNLKRSLVNSSSCSTLEPEDRKWD